MNEAEKTEVEPTTEQESPAVEQKPVEETAEKPEQTPETEAPQEPEQEKNWRAVREELESLKKERDELKSKVQPEPTVKLGEAKKSEAVRHYIQPEDVTSLQLDEFKAEQAFPEMETNKLFGKAVAGEYRAALDKYAEDVLYGRPAKLPSAFNIARQVKGEWESTVGAISKQSEVEGAKKAQQAKDALDATVDAEGRSDRGRAAARSANLEELQRTSRKGGTKGLEAIAERIKASGL